MIVVDWGFQWMQYSQPRAASTISTMYLRPGWAYSSSVKASTYSMAMKQKMPNSTQKVVDFMLTTSASLSPPSPVRSLLVTLYRSQQLTGSIISFFSPWICWNTSTLPPWSGWCTLRAYLKLRLTWSGQWRRVRFMLWKAEGYQMRGRASGAGRSRGAGTGSQGMTVLAIRRMMTFSIMTLILRIIKNHIQNFSDEAF